MTQKNSLVESLQVNWPFYEITYVILLAQSQSLTYCEFHATASVSLQNFDLGQFDHTSCNFWSLWYGTVDAAYWSTD